MSLARYFRAWLSVSVKSKVQRQAVALLSLSFRSSLLISALVRLKLFLIKARREQSMQRKSLSSWRAKLLLLWALQRVDSILTSDRRLAKFALANFRSHANFQRRSQGSVTRRSFAAWRRHTEISRAFSGRAKATVIMTASLQGLLQRRGVFPVGSRKTVSMLVAALQGFFSEHLRGCFARLRHGLWRKQRQLRSANFLAKAIKKTSETDLKFFMLKLGLNSLAGKILRRAKKTLLEAWRGRTGKVRLVIGNLSKFEFRPVLLGLNLWRATTQATKRREISVRLLRDRLGRVIRGFIRKFRSEISEATRKRRSSEILSATLLRNFRSRTAALVKRRISEQREIFAQKAFLAKLAAAVRSLGDRKFLLRHFRSWSRDIARVRRHGNFSQKISDLHQRMAMVETFRRWRSLGAVRNWFGLVTQFKTRMIGNFKSVAIDRRLSQSRTERLTTEIGNFYRRRLRQAFSRLLAFRGFRVIGNFVCTLQRAALRQALSFWRAENFSLARKIQGDRICRRLEVSVRRSLLQTGLRTWRGRAKSDRVIGNFLRCLASLVSRNFQHSGLRRWEFFVKKQRQAETALRRLETKTRRSEISTVRKFIEVWLGLVVDRREKELHLKRKSERRNFRLGLAGFWGNKLHMQSCRKFLRVLSRKISDIQISGLLAWKTQILATRNFRSATGRLVLALRFSVSRQLAAYFARLRKFRKLDVSILRLRQAVNRKRRSFSALLGCHRKFLALRHLFRRLDDRKKQLAFSEMRMNAQSSVLTARAVDSRVETEKVVARLATARFLILAAAKVSDERSSGFFFRRWRRLVESKARCLSMIGRILERRLAISGLAELRRLVNFSMLEEMERARNSAVEWELKTSENGRKSRASEILFRIFSARLTRGVFYFFSKMRKAVFSRRLTAVERASRAAVAERETESKRQAEMLEMASRNIETSEMRNLRLSEELEEVGKELMFLRDEREQLHSRLRDSVEEVEFVASRMNMEKGVFSRTQEEVERLRKEVAASAELKEENELLKLEIEKFKLRASESKFSESLAEMENKRLMEELQRTRAEAEENRRLMEAEVDSLRLSVRQDEIDRLSLAKSHSFYKSKCQLLTEQLKAFELRMSQSREAQMPALLTGASFDVGSSWEVPRRIPEEEEDEALIGESLASLQMAIQGRSGLRRQRS